MEVFSMNKVFKTAVSSLAAASMLASIVPAAFADGYNNSSLQETIKKFAEQNGITYKYDADTNKGTADVTLDADTFVRKTVTSGTENAFQNGYILGRFSTGKTAELTGDFKSTLNMEPVRKAFEAYKNAANETVEKDSALSALLPTVPVKGEFTIDVIYDSRMQIADKDKYLETGKMTGFNDEAKEIFIDTKRTDAADPDHEGYNKFSVTVQVKAPTTEALQGVSHTGSWANTLVYADLEKSYETLLKDIDFTLPSVTVSEDPFSGTDLYYTESIDMTGSIVIGAEMSTINFDVQQAEGGANDYRGVKDWEKISATMALLKQSTGGGGGGGGSNARNTPAPVQTPNITVPTLAPGETATPTPDASATVDPNASPAPTLNPDGTTPNPDVPSVTPKPFTPWNSTVPSALNGEDHMVYVIGYPEGDVRPLNNITREEIATIFYRLLTTEKRDSIYTKESGFSDVLKSRWSNKAIATMANGKYILGDAGTTNFRPADSITRAEMAAIVSRFLDTTPEIADSSDDFNDINGHWAATAIKEGVAAGWLTGYGDNSFKPDQKITRAEAMTVINRMLVRYVNEEGLVDGYVQWPDNPKDAWYYYNVIEATNSHKYDTRTFETSADFYEKWTEMDTNWVWGDFKTQYEDPDEIDRQ